MIKEFECEEGKELELAVHILIYYCELNGVTNPIMEKNIHTFNNKDGRDHIYKMTFERVDLDIMNELNIKSDEQDEGMD